MSNCCAITEITKNVVFLNSLLHNKTSKTGRIDVERDIFVGSKST